MQLLAASGIVQTGGHIDVQPIIQARLLVDVKATVVVSSSEGGRHDSVWRHNVLIHSLVRYLQLIIEVELDRHLK